MRRITLFLFAALAVTSVDAASYEQNDGTIVDPIQSVYGGDLPYSGDNLEPSANLNYANLTDANLTDANLNYANLTDAVLTGADLTNVDLTIATPLQASLVWDASASNYGYLWQYSIPPSLGSEACGPTATTNAFTYLQNTQGGRIGNVLTGDNYAAWLTTAETLANDYMQTGGTGSTIPGTSFPNLATGMQQYAQHWHEQNSDRAKIQFNGVSAYDPEHPERGTFPDWVKLQENGPTIEQLYEMLAGGAGVTMGINQGVQLGHVVTLAGMDWDDINGDGIVDRGEATLSVIDPLDPSSHYENPEPEPYGADGLQPQKAALTTLDVWQSAFVFNPEISIPMLAIEYMQYHGSGSDPSGGHYGPYEPENYEDTTSDKPYFVSVAYGMRAVPEPTSVLLWSSLVLGVTLTRRRRAA